MSCEYEAVSKRVTIRGQVREKQLTRKLSSISDCESIEIDSTEMTPLDVMSVIFSDNYTIIKQIKRVYLIVPNWDSNDLEKFGIEWFAKSTKYISELSISNISKESSKGLLSFVKRFRTCRRTKLTSLTLKNIKIQLTNSYKGKYFHKLFQYLLNTSKNKGLKELYVNEIHLGNTGMMEFVEQLQFNSTLRRFDVTYTNRKCLPKQYHEIIKKLTINTTITGAYFDEPIQFSTGQSKKNQSNNAFRILSHRCNELLQGTLRVNKYLHEKNHFKDHYCFNTKQLNLSGENINQKLINDGLLRQITTLYPEIEILDLSNNQIEEISSSKSFLKLKNLKSLNLLNNNIKIFSPYIATLHFQILLHEEIENNQENSNCLANIPPHYLVHKQDGIKEYYNDLKNQKKQLINRTRCIIIGGQSDPHGKKKFIKLLCKSMIHNLNLNCNLKQKIQAGITVTSIPDYYDDNQTNEPSTIFSVWNITSSHIKNTCMRIFSTIKRTIYIILFNAKKPSKCLSKLNLVQSSAPGSNVFLICQHIEKISQNQLQKLAMDLENEISLWKQRMTHVNTKPLQIHRNTENGVNCIFFPMIGSYNNSKEFDFNNCLSNFISNQFEQIPINYLALLRYIREKRNSSITISPVLYASDFKEFSNDIFLNQQEFDDALCTLSDWGEIIHFPEDNEMILIQPQSIGTFFEATFSEMEQLNTITSSVEEIEHRWLTNNFDISWFDCYWNILFRFDICTIPFDQKRKKKSTSSSSVILSTSVSSKQIPKHSSTNNNDNHHHHHKKKKNSSTQQTEFVKIPHLAPSRPKKRKRDRLISYLRNDIVLGRNFVFNFILPDFTSRCLNRVGNEFCFTDLIFVQKHEIWRDCVVLDLGLSLNDDPIQLVVSQYDTPEDDNLFRATIEIHVHVQQGKIEFARQILGSTSFLLDNFVRDQFPQLHENHMEVFVVGQIDHQLTPLISREECTKLYVTEKQRSFRDIPMENLIPEVINPINIFVRRK